MATVQWHYTETKRSESGQTGTVTYDLPQSGTIPLIVVRAYSTPTASTDPALPLNKAITKIEIVDGSETLVSLSANQLLGILTHRVKRKHASTEINDNAAEGYEGFEIHLGGLINNRLYAPDFSRLNNPQIKITWDYSLTTGQFGATFDADASPAMKFTVFSKIIRGSSRYSAGYIKSKDIKTFTSAASTVTRVEIPKGLPLLGIMIEAGYVSKDWTEDVEKIKLDFDNGKWTPLNLQEEEIAPFENEVFGPAEISFTCDLIDAVEIDTHMGFVTSISGITHSSAGRSFEYDGVHQGVRAVGLMDVATPTAISTYEQVTINVEGFMPYNCFYIPASALQDNDNDLIDTTVWRDIILEITQGASVSTSSTPTVIAEYLVTQ